MKSGAVDLENSVIPFHEKIRFKKKLTKHEIHELIMYRNQLQACLNQIKTDGQGKKAVQKCFDKLNDRLKKEQEKNDLLYNV